MSYTLEDILSDLDDNGGMQKPYKFFPTLEDAYTTVSSNKIHLFADGDRWAIVFEINAYNNRGFCIQKTHTYFGNCLENLDRAGLDNFFICNTKDFDLSTHIKLSEIEGDFETVSETATTIKIRGEEFPIEHNLSTYFLNHIPWRKYDISNKTIDFPSLTRMLNLQHPDVFNSTAEELRTSIPNDLPQIMTINEWYHTDCYRANGYEATIPRARDNETFQLIAKVLVSKDTSVFKPTLKPNSHWSNWNSGDLSLGLARGALNAYNTAFRLFWYWLSP